MVTKDAEKNCEYLKRANEKKKAQLGEEQYKKYFATNDANYRTNKKTKIWEDEYKKEQAEYMRQYRASKKGQEKKPNVEAYYIVFSILNDIIDVAPNIKIVNGELKKKRGRKIR